ncbi:MAG TPA: hypothetical protein VK021_01765, partial [Flavobacteriaceae bacterium]|nr:hypothetical protein [Flavobacteriaceae bacterium]
EKAKHEYPIGQIFETKHDLKVAVNGGFIYILKMQMPGKRKMSNRDVLNGLELKEKSLMF